MKNRTILLILTGFFAFSFITNARAQNSYNILLDSTFIYNWDNNKQDWILSQSNRYNYVYGTGSQLAEIDQYDNMGNIIAIDSRTYTDSSMVRIIQNPNNGTLINKLKYFTLYDNMHKEIYSETYTWSNNEWIRADKVLYKYDGEYLVQLIRQYLFNGLFQDVQQIDYVYDQDFHLTEYLITNIITNTPVRRILYTYNSLNQRIEGLMQNWMAGDWSINGKLTYSYDPCGTLKESFNFGYSNSVFVNLTKSQFFYSPHFFDGNNRKVPVCHNGHTIYISKNALKAHLAHGDCIGECAFEKKPEKQGFDEKEKSDKPPFTIYPNPAREKITIKFDRDECKESKRVELTDYNGKIIRSFNVKDNGDLTIYRGNLISGKYCVKLIGEEVYSALVIFK